MAEQPKGVEVPGSLPTEPSKLSLVGGTVLEMIAQPVTLEGIVEAVRPPRTTQTQQRTWDPIGRHPDTRPDIQSD